MSLASDISSIHARNPSEVFRNAYSVFLNTIPENERPIIEGYSDLDEMSVAIHRCLANMCDEKQKSRLERFAQGCRKVASYMKPYFSIIETWVSVKPEYLGLVWGTIKLIFQLSTNYLEYAERISEAFEDIGQSLRVYEIYLEKFLQRFEKQPENIPRRLQSTMADVYVDVISFFYRVIRLFSKKTRVGLKLSHRLTRRRAWKPFDLEFQDVMTRLGNHRTVFEFEVRAAADSEALAFYNRFDKELEKNASETEEDKARTMGMQNFGALTEILVIDLVLRRVQDSTIERLGDWIRPPQWKARYEEMLRMKEPETGGWILEHPGYRSWRVCEDPDRPVLLIEGNPGFGKSTLCTVVIDRLQQAHGASPDPPINAVAYYFFDRHHQQQEIGLALRSLLVQMLHSYRRDEKAVDIVSTLFDHKVVGQPAATDLEVFTILRLMLAQFPGFAFIIDAVDECIDPPTFLHYVDELMMDCRRCWLVLFSRPTVLLPSAVRDKSAVLSLRQGHNTADMIQFLRPRLENLVGEGLIPPPEYADEYLDAILARANGLFLWTKLLIALLESRRMSISQRLDAIDNLNRLQGLDNIYREISGTLINGETSAAAANVKAGFIWVLGACRPVTVGELATAMLQPVNGPLKEGDAIPDLEQSIGHIFGGLLEVIGHNTVQFIHGSAHEYFIFDERETNLFTSSTGGLRFTRAEIELGISLRIMGYLAHTLPPRPLSGDADTSIDARDAHKRFPLLDYAVLFWSNHVHNLVREAWKHQAEPSFGAQCQQLFELLTQFLYNGDRLCVWFEASWTFGNPPSLCPLPHDMLLALREMGVTVRLLTDDYPLLSDDIEALTESWSYLLEAEPHVIWDESLTIFSQSKFLRRTSQSRLMHFEYNEADMAKTILIVSHTSWDGTASAAVRLAPPMALASLRADQLGPVEPFGWTAHYTLWNLESKMQILALAWVVDSRAMKLVLDLATKRQPEMRGNTRFMFPVAISQDLRQVVALNSVVRLEGPLIANQAKACHSHLDVFNRIPPAWRCIGPVLDNSIQLKSWTVGKYFIVVVFRHASGVFLSQRGKLAYEGLLQFFVCAGRDEAAAAADASSSSGVKSNPEDYACFGSWPIDLPGEYLRNYLKESLVFHPSQPLVVFTAFTPFGRRIPGQRPQSAQTFLWDFSRSIGCEGTGVAAPSTRISNRSLYRPCDGILQCAAFSPDGQFLHGKQPGEHGLYVVIDLDECMSSSSSAMGSIATAGMQDASPSRAPSGSQCSGLQEQRKHLEARGAAVAVRPQDRQTLTRMLDGMQIQPTQSANTLCFSSRSRQHGGAQQPEISQLLESSARGAVVLRSLTADGRLQVQTLARLPENLRWSSTATILQTGPPEGEGADGSDMLVRLSLDKAEKHLYSIADLEDRRPQRLQEQLPAVLERSSATIPTATYHIPRLMSRGSTSGASTPQPRVT
ncbi:uncharacterized protein BO95DRAFT_514793 [Aspergillus brunneoviolaceus CBS 621.78]|uniref:Uncharacterized protein n=1 Tax=Aspergillus brunneoviolaceus CBS 621.78 TaxID=1450534 RepID=A0ACD1G852_9EURO|nr:hypothetical protein BO95DRAFT_514793 [Aspergillus brunneoviolaceus CBS 621.78]RAH45301.1 hypothetical protein BO95DRAFT_514793 [Aspergillus brunneoviolaceus CBS 621.78]